MDENNIVNNENEIESKDSEELDAPNFGKKEEKPEEPEVENTEETEETSGGLFESPDEEDEEEAEESSNSKEDKNKWPRRIMFIIIIILLLLLGSCGVMWKKAKDSCDVSPSTPTPLVIDKNQGDYSAEEEASNGVKMVTLPGWGAFNIPANTSTITKGFEFHNPASNEWYEDTVVINDITTESFIVGQGTTEIDHLLRLAGINNTMKSVVSYDENYFKVYMSSNNSWVIEGVAGYEGTKEVVIETADGEEVTLHISSKRDFYYMTFALYLGTPDNTEEAELLYQSNLVEPGKYIQRMDLSRSIKAGTYDAFVLCQPYKSDASTRTNNGVVKITLNVK